MKRSDWFGLAFGLAVGGIAVLLHPAEPLLVHLAAIVFSVVVGVGIARLRERLAR